MISHVFSASNDELDNIFASESTPAGVVFEIVDWDDEYLLRTSHLVTTKLW